MTKIYLIVVALFLAFIMFGWGFNSSTPWLPIIVVFAIIGSIIFYNDKKQKKK
jgi:hypothetical protein